MSPERESKNIKAHGITCQFCNKPCNTSCLYLHRYAHISCATNAYLMTDEGVRDNDWYVDSEAELAELNAATGPKFKEVTR